MFVYTTFTLWESSTVFMSLELETLLYIEVGVKYKNALQKE